MNKHVLIPRFDTEILVETAILNLKPGAKVLDLCTGSGCIAVILAKHGFDVVATDISKKALKIAKRNAKLNSVQDKIKFIKSDLFENLGGYKFDAIISNPPYIKTNELGLFDKSTLHEPKLALDGGADGLEYYRKIALEGSKFGTPGAKFGLEICKNGLVDVQNLLRENGFHDIVVVKDRAGLERVILCSKN